MWGHQFAAETKDDDEIKIAILDIDGTVFSATRQINEGEPLKLILNEKYLSPFIIKLVSGMTGVYFCTHRTDYNYDENVLKSSGELKNINDYKNTIKTFYDQLPFKDNDEKWYRLMKLTGAPNPSSHLPNIMHSEIKPDDCCTHNVIKNFTEMTGVPCLGVVTPGFAADLYKQEKNISSSPSRFYEQYTEADSNECKQNFETLKKTSFNKNTFNYDKIELNSFSKNIQLKLILNKIAKKYPGKKTTITFVDDRPELCEAAANELQDYCNDLAKEGKGRITLKVILHKAYKDTNDEIPVAGNAQYYAPAAPKAVDAPVSQPSVDETVSQSAGFSCHYRLM